MVHFHQDCQSISSASRLHSSTWNKIGNLTQFGRFSQCMYNFKMFLRLTYFYRESILAPIAPVLCHWRTNIDFIPSATCIGPFKWWDIQRCQQLESVAARCQKNGQEQIPLCWGLGQRSNKNISNRGTRCDKWLMVVTTVKFSTFYPPFVI